MCDMASFLQFGVQSIISGMDCSEWVIYKAWETPHSPGKITVIEYQVLRGIINVDDCSRTFTEKYEIIANGQL